VPELPELQAHAERLTAAFAGTQLAEFRPLTFTVMKTATPPYGAADGSALRRVGRRGKYLLLEFEPLTFAVHLMQGGRLKPDEKQSAKPRDGQARWRFADGPALLLTEAGRERRAGVWTDPVVATDGLGPEADQIDAATLAAGFAAVNMRLHGYLRNQHHLAGIGRRLANEVCHRAQLSPFVMTGKLGPAGADTVVQAIGSCIDEALIYERSRPDMSASADRPGAVHHRTGQACPRCGDIVREVSYSSHTVNYCATCQTGGKVLADNTTSRFVK
jgi:formamidopyrimidine-DNA glycosylase